MVEENEKSQIERTDADTPNPLETTLQQTRLDLESQLRLGIRLNEELLRLRRQNESLMEDLEAAHRKNMHCEKLIHEYFVQNQELRHNLIDDRFRQARAREQHQRQQTSSSLRFSKDSFSLSPRSQRQQSPDKFNPLALPERTTMNTVHHGLSGLSEETSNSDSLTKTIPTQNNNNTENDIKDGDESCGDNARKSPSSKWKGFSFSKTM